MKSQNTKITHRDMEVFDILKLLPLTTTQIFRISQAFSFPFPSERVVYRRMQKLASGGLARRFYFAFPSSGRNPLYWRLTNKSFQLTSEANQLTQKHRRSVASIGVSLHFHSHQLSEFLICLLLSAKKSAVDLQELKVESPISLGNDGESIIPDASFAFAAPDGGEFRFFVELDTGTERVATLQRVPSSIQKKLEFYERLRQQSTEPFRVLFVTTSSERRATNILRFSDRMSTNPTSRLIYAAHLPRLLQQNNCVTGQAFLDHKQRPVRLIRKPTYCKLQTSSSVEERAFAYLNHRSYRQRRKNNTSEVQFKR
ncbi:MAG: replication-relaxation family protein [Planctomycetota bacterium]